ncbi:hypothetical protein MCAG_02366 [Micromonospora sp. ATCC 39149]|uniref:Immunity protein 50 n=1 Tax=Micromonospora carbonacea TaxID=47853 RepID=A0A7D5Y7U8_9ACTN|nr:hypothetical protein [Micromonospora sp. ATCC 39149]EEP72039.1 hypothetical protein MCAG_02366 [Micromonospora sp. ATCC 39149]QLJ98241.1 hypothetical protein HZU44_26585 [Micromonospora carbonacea]
MRFVNIRSEPEDWPSNVLDPAPYLEVLPGLLPQLPMGARAYASDPGHYDFASLRCVKDLRIGSIALREAGHAQISIDIEFKANEFKHDASLLIRYVDVTRWEISVGLLGEGVRIWPESRRLGDVQLDEVLPAPNGCLHEVQMTGGTIVVACRDLRAEWVPIARS